MYSLCSQLIRHSLAPALSHMLLFLYLVQSVVTYTAAGPTTNGKTVLANCEVSEAFTVFADARQQ